jgi:hypothetical protein
VRGRAIRPPGRLGKLEPIEARGRSNAPGKLVFRAGAGLLSSPRTPGFRANAKASPPPRCASRPRSPLETTGGLEFIQIGGGLFIINDLEPEIAGGQANAAYPFALLLRSRPESGGPAARARRGSLRGQRIAGVIAYTAMAE